MIMAQRDHLIQVHLVIEYEVLNWLEFIQTCLYSTSYMIMPDLLLLIRIMCSEK